MSTVPPSTPPPPPPPGGFPPPPGAFPPEAPYPARLTIDYPEQLDRVTTAFRIVLIIPIGIVLSILTNSSTNTFTTENGDLGDDRRERASSAHCS